MASKALIPLAALLLAGCGKEENSPDMGAVPPKPNPSMLANTPAGASGPSDPGADARAMAASKKH